MNKFFMAFICFFMLTIKPVQGIEVSDGYLGLATGVMTGSLYALSEVNHAYDALGAWSTLLTPIIMASVINSSCNDKKDPNKEEKVTAYLWSHTVAHGLTARLIGDKNLAFSAIIPGVITCLYMNPLITLGVLFLITSVKKS